MAKMDEATLKRVRALIQRLFGVAFSEVHVWRLLVQIEKRYFTVWRGAGLAGAADRLDRAQKAPVVAERNRYP